jgi:predicted ABC-type ATPase
MDKLSILIIAGPNGAGKTTFAREFLTQEANCPTFINADLIAAGLSPIEPEKAAMQAGRLMLQTMSAAVAEEESFAFESTLAGIGYASKIPRWRNLGYRISLIFLKLDNVDIAIGRVAERVRQGGHNIPETVIRRRYIAGWRNFRTIYSRLVNDWTVFDNSSSQSTLLDWGENYE